MIASAPPPPLAWPNNSRQIDPAPAHNIGAVLDYNSADEPTPDGIVEYVGATLVLDLSQMDIGHPYRITYRGAPAIAIKRQDGSIDFYRIPNEH